MFMKVDNQVGDAREREREREREKQKFVEMRILRLVE